VPVRGLVLTIRTIRLIRRIRPMGWRRAGGMLVAALCLTAATALAAPRFPQPEFDSGHIVPTPTQPLPPSAVPDWIALAVLAAALALTSYFAVRNRSRKGIFAVMMFSLVYFGFMRQGCICPVGSLQNVVQALFDPRAAVPLTVLGFFLLPLVTALFFGRTFCAGVCFLGALQDLVICRPVNVPVWLVRCLGMIAWFYLGAVVLFAATGSGFLACRLDPFVSLVRQSGTPTILALGACFLALGAFVARPYCRFACPYGVLLGWLSHLARRHTAITPDECDQCRLCENACPFSAIRKPAQAQNSEPRRVSARRLGLVLALLPVLIFAGEWAGARLGAAQASANRYVQLTEHLAAENADRTVEATLASQAFRASGRSVADLDAQVADLRAKFARFGMWIGAVFGLAFGAQLIRLSVPGRNKDYEPDRGLCLSCGRCFSYCPREQLRRRQGQSITEAKPRGGPEVL